MADNQPIKYSDLVKPDNSIEELIKQLTELKDTYTDALASIKAEAIQLAATLQKVSGATEVPRTSLMMRLETLPRSSYGRWLQTAVMKSDVSTQRRLTTHS